jgi:hypothetical protein
LLVKLLNVLITAASLVCISNPVWFEERWTWNNDCRSADGILWFQQVILFLYLIKHAMCEISEKNNRQWLVSLFNFRWPFPKPIIVKTYIHGKLRTMVCMWILLTGIFTV